MEPEGSLHWRGLVGEFLADSDHGLHALGGHQHFVQTQECVLQRLAQILSRLKLLLFFEFGLEESLAKFSAFEASVAVEHREQPYALVEVGVGDVSVFLKQHG